MTPAEFQMVQDMARLRGRHVYMLSPWSVLISAYAWESDETQERRIVRHDDTLEIGLERVSAPFINELEYTR